MEWECQPLDLDCLIKESYLSHLAASTPLGQAEGDWVHDGKQPWEHLLPHEVHLAGTNASWRPALAMYWLSSRCSSTMYSSCHQWGSSLCTSTYSPQYTCSTTSRISWSVDPRRVLTEGWAGAITLAISICWVWGCLLVVLSCFFLHIAAALWSRHSSRENPYSWQWVMLWPRWSLLS